MAEKKKLTRQDVLDYLGRKGYRTSLEGTQKFAEFIYLCYQSRYVNEDPRLEFGKIEEKVAKKYKSDPVAVGQHMRYLCHSKYPNKTRAEVVNMFLEELSLLLVTNRPTVLAGSRIEYYEDDNRYRRTMMFLAANDFDISRSIDIYIERPEYGGKPSPFYEIGVMDAKQSRVVLKNTSALTVGDGARNQRLADIYYCFDIIRYIYKEVKTGNNMVLVNTYCDIPEFFQGNYIESLVVE